MDGGVTTGSRKLILPQDEGRREEHASEGSVTRQNHNHQGLVHGRIWGHGEEASAARDAFNLPLAQGSLKRGIL